MNVVNTFCWIDIPVTDLPRSIKFYQEVLAKPIHHINEHGFEFGLLPHENDNVSGCLAVMPDRKPSQNGALVYLNVEGRLADAVLAATKNGGQELSPITQMGPYGHRAVILDSEGNAVALYSKEA